MKNKTYIVLFFLLSVLFIFSNYPFLSITAAFFMLPLMMLLTLNRSLFFIILPPLAWSSVLLYPVLLVSYNSYNLIATVGSYLAINILLSLPLFVFLLTYKTEKYRLFSPLIYIFTLYLLKDVVFQILPTIMIFQSEWLRYFATRSVSVWLTTALLLYLQIYVAEIIRCKNYRQTKKYIFIISVFFIVTIMFPQKTTYSTENIKIMGIPLAVALGDSTNLNDIIIKMEQELKKAPDTRIVVFSESSWLGFKPGNNRLFTETLITYLTEKSLTDKRVYLLQTDGLIYHDQQINNVLTVKIENGHLWYTGKTILVPGWEIPIIKSGRQTLMDNYFEPQKNKNNFMVDGVTIQPEICYEVLFMPPLIQDKKNVTLVQSSYIIFYSLGGKRAYDHIVRVSNLLGWFSHSAAQQTYINIQNHGGSEAISASGKKDKLFFNASYNKAAIITVIN